MEKQPQFSEYREAGCVFLVDRVKRTLKVEGAPDVARLSILKLKREGWLPDDLRAIWFDGNPVIIVVGINLTMYLASKPDKPKPSPRSFKDIINTKS